jgi:hypothetical protein
MIFSVTNQKIFNYVGTTGKPIIAEFRDDESKIGFADYNDYNSPVYGVSFSTDGKTKMCLSEGYLMANWRKPAFLVDFDAMGKNEMTGVKDTLSYI